MLPDNNIKIDPQVFISYGVALGGASVVENPARIAGYFTGDVIGMNSSHVIDPKYLGVGKLNLDLDSKDPYIYQINAKTIN